MSPTSGQGYAVRCRETPQRIYMPSTVHFIWPKLSELRDRTRGNEEIGRSDRSIRVAASAAIEARSPNCIDHRGNDAYTEKLFEAQRYVNFVMFENQKFKSRRVE